STLFSRPSLEYYCDWKMLRYFVVTLLVMAGMLGTTWGQEFPEGTQDGPCPNIGFRGRWRRFHFTRIWGTWHEQVRSQSYFQPTQCPTTNTWSGIPPSANVISAGTSPDGTTNEMPRNGVIGDVPNQILFPNPMPSPSKLHIYLTNIYIHYIFIYGMI
ncbi:unnamed protein product, partial [Meganyctiphanes norvegica]